MVDVHGQAIEGVGLWRGENVSLDKLIEILCALALGASWAVTMDGAAQVCLDRCEGGMLHHVVDHWQLVDLSMLGIVDVFCHIG